MNALKIGKYGLLFVSVFLTFLKFCLIYVFIWIGYIIAFHMLFVHKKPQFTSVFYTIPKTLAMLTGEYDFDDLFFPNGKALPGSEAALVLYSTFVFTMNIVIMNIMVRGRFEEEEKSISFFTSGRSRRIRCQTFSFECETWTSACANRDLSGSPGEIRFALWDLFASGSRPRETFPLSLLSKSCDTTEQHPKILSLEIGSSNLACWSTSIDHYSSVRQHRQYKSGDGGPASSSASSNAWLCHVRSRLLPSSHGSSWWTSSPREWSSQIDAQDWWITWCFWKS